MISTKLIYSLPFNCPIEWPIKPNYPIASNVRDLNLVYKNTLFNIENQPLKFALDNFARLLLSLTAEQSSNSLSILLRSLILPAKEFDKRWRNTIPELFKPIDENLTLPISSVTGGGGKNREKEKLVEEKAKLSELEKENLLECHERWKESLRKDSGLIPAVIVKEVVETESEEGKKMVVDGIEEVQIAEGSSKPASWLVQDDKIGDWLRDLETLETLIQSLLLLTLLCLPPPTSLDALPTATTAPSRRRAKDPQRSNTTLDPEILLDFLTDRLQVWAAIKSMTGTGLGKDINGIDNVRIEIERDLVQCWWEDIVEPLFSPHLLPDLLLHHRVKLFPSTSSTFALSTAASYVPSPSPYKKSTDRSLLSLDKSARRKEWQEEKDRIPESPTMRRLGINAGSRLSTGSVMGEEEEVFKVPVAPRRRGSVSGSGIALGSSTSSGSLDPFMTSMTTDTTSASTLNSTSIASINPTSSKSRSRKQERPRPSTSSLSTNSRGDSMVSSLKGLFTRREVSLARRPNGSSSSSSSTNLFSTSSSSKIKKSDPSSSNTSMESDVSQTKVLGMTTTGRTSRPRKRKSLSPQKRPISESTFLSTSSSSSSSSSSTSATRQILAIDTPQKITKHSKEIIIGGRPKNPLVPTSLSFAALGAAFRPGLPQPPDLPKGIPRPPILSDDDDDEEGEVGSGEDRMDWEDLRGGRNSGGGGGGMMGTPVRKGREEWCVPDT